jgi:hypothetical protein
MGWATSAGGRGRSGKFGTPPEDVRVGARGTLPVGGDALTEESARDGSETPWGLPHDGTRFMHRRVTDPRWSRVTRDRLSGGVPGLGKLSTWTPR